MQKSKKILIAIIITIIIVSGVSYGTYAFFSASATDNSIGGTSQELDFNVTATEVYKASSLIPISENTADTTINATNQCRDNNNRDICSLYQVTVTNSGITTSLTGFIRTTSSTYTTTNLKYKVYTKTNNTYTAVTDASSLSNDSGGSTYFKTNNNNYIITLPNNSSQTYYVLFWINEIKADQNQDQGKNYSCRFGFEGTTGSQLSASFNI